jgi:hypothetical protein
MPYSINEVGGIELALRGYTASQFGARVPISTVWNALRFDFDTMASIIDLVVDLLRTSGRGEETDRSWTTFKDESRCQFAPVPVREY